MGSVYSSNQVNYRSSCISSYDSNLIFASIWATVDKMDLSEWMSLLPDSVVEKPIIQLAIPGTHNSMSYTIKRYANPSPDVEYIANINVPMLCRPWVRKWCKTQSLDVTEQLRHGIRYFDLRLCRKKSTRKIFVCHGMFGGEVIPELVKINYFLNNHTNEVVILDFQHFFEFLLNDHNDLLESLKQIFGKKLCPTPTFVKSINLTFMRKELFQVIIVYRESICCNFVWPSSYWKTCWPDTMSPQKMIDYCNVQVSKRDYSCGLVNQCVLTATLMTMISPRGSIIKSCATKAYQPTLNWIKKCWETKLPINVVIADFIEWEDNHFSKLLITYNFQ